MLIFRFDAHPSLFKYLKSLALFLVLGLAACSDTTSNEGISNADYAENNRAVALMGRFEYSEATQVFAGLLEQHPNWHEVRTNYAIGLKNRQQDGDADRALSELAIVLAAQPENLHASYTTGVLHLYLGNVEAAQAYFETTLASDPEDAYAHYYLGQCQLRTGDQAGALVSYQRAIEHDPYLRSAYYSAAQVLRRLERSDEANQQLALFSRFENNPSARLAEFKYTRMGPKALVKVLGEQPSSKAMAKMPEGSIFGAKLSLQKVNQELGNLAAHAEMHITTVDYNQNGSQDIFIASGNSSPNTLYLASTDSQQSDLRIGTENPFSDITHINAVAWGDIDNDGLTDVYFCRTGKNQLWMQQETGEWKQTKVDSSAVDSANDCSDATLLDADHDGDLDILIANQDARDELLNNNRDGSFRSLATKLTGEPESTVIASLRSQDQEIGSRNLLTTDIDADGDVDIIFVSTTVPHRVLLNDRQWSYRTSEKFTEFENSAFVALAATDLNADAQVELVSLDGQGLVRLWQPNNAGVWQATIIYESPLDIDDTAKLLAIDVNGNGTSELVVSTVQGYQVVGLTLDAPTPSLVQVEQASELYAQLYQGSPVAAVIRSMQGSSLIAVEEIDTTVNVVEWPPGNGRFDFVTLSFSGKHDAAETMRSNRSAIGTRVSARVGNHWSLSDTHKNTSARGYSLQPLAIGLAGQEKADFVAVNWSDGVYQTELDVASGTHTSIAEQQRQLGSCPVLFAWNGEKHAFVTDILGVGAQGFLVEPGSIMPPRPWEYISFKPGSLAPRDGRIEFKLTEPMEESSYIDSMSLESVDLPQGWSLLLDERMATGAPAVTGKAMFYQSVVTPKSAVNSARSDVLEAVSHKDNIAMPVDNIDRRFIGILEQAESLTLEFEKPINSLDSKPQALPVLMADAWVELPYSQTHFSVWQAGKQYRAVSLEARDLNNKWHVVYPDFGIPAGMPRETALPLSDLPNNTVALRLSWNRELYWDRIQIVYAEQAPTESRRETILPVLANVANSGFSKRYTHAQRRAEYDYQQRETYGDVRYATGLYTNMGEMTELIDTADDALAIIGPGEEIHVEFNAPPPPAEGLRRWYILETRGWAKDKDRYTELGSTVGPLPRAHPNADLARRENLHQQYNNRFLSGR